MKTLSILALVMASAAPVMAQEAPAGAAATGCDVNSYNAVRSERTGEVLYWTNSTCSGSPDNSAAMGGMGMMGGMNAGMGAGMNAGMGGNMNAGMGGNMNAGMGGSMSGEM